MPVCFSCFSEAWVDSADPVDLEAAVSVAAVLEAAEVVLEDSAVVAAVAAAPRGAGNNLRLDS